MSLNPMKKFTRPAALFCFMGACTFGVWDLAELRPGVKNSPAAAVLANRTGATAAKAEVVAAARTGDAAETKTGGATEKKVGEVAQGKKESAAAAPKADGTGAPNRTHASGNKKRRTAAGSSRPVDCNKLPTKKEFLRANYNPESILKIQTCLMNKGHYTGRLDGIGGPLTLAALQRASTAPKALPPFPTDDPVTVYRLTKQDLEELKTFNKIVSQLQQLDGVEYESSLELRTAVKDVLEEVDIPGDYRTTILEHLDTLKKPALSDEDLVALEAKQIPEPVVNKLRVLEGIKYGSKGHLVMAVEEKLLELPEPDDVKTMILEELDEVAAEYFLPEEFFMNLERLRVPDEILDLLKKIEDVEYPNKKMFLNMLSEVDLRVGQEKVGERPNGEILRHYAGVLVDKAEKIPAFDKDLKVKWNGWSYGCYMENFSEVAYAFYPYWMAGSEQFIDFSSISRIGYFAVTFDELGNIQERRHWEPKYADFINQAHRHRTAVDLVFYKNKWDKWAQFVAEDQSAFIDRLTTNMVEAVSRKLTNTLLNRMMPVVSLGTIPTPTMGDGITIYFEGYPEDEASMDFLKKLLSTLRSKLDAAAREDGVRKGFRFNLNVLLQYKEVDKIKQLSFKHRLPTIETPPNQYQPYRTLLLESNVDLFLVFLEEPTTATKKKLRAKMEEFFFGDFRSTAMRRVVPVLITGIQHRDEFKEGQFKDDVAYFEDNFGGVGLWPVPTSKDQGADVIASTIKKFFTNGNRDFFQKKLAEYVPGVVRLVGTYRWELRIVRDLLLAVILVFAILSNCLFELQAFLRKKYLWAMGVVGTTFLIEMSLLLEDPSLRDVTTAVLFLTVILGAVIGIFIFIGKIRQADLP